MLSESNCGCALALPCIWPEGKNVVDTFYRLFVDLRAGQDGRFSNRKSGRSSIFNAGGKTSLSLEQTGKPLRDQD